MVLLATLALLISVVECWVSSKAANNYLKGKESKARDIIEETQRTIVTKKAEIEPLDVLIKNAVISSGVEIADDGENSQKYSHPLFPIPMWTARKPCIENLQLWVCKYTCY